ncbi:MAG: prephenate/arogenate dehydrogenase family protein [Cohaesibacteraceae bacterium]
MAAETYSSADFPYDRLALIGAGLIGTSVAHAVRKRAPDTLIAFADNDPATVAELASLFPDNLSGSDPAIAVKDADLVLLCVPVGAIGAVSDAIAPHLKAGATVSDVGSVKMAVLDQLAGKFGPDVHVVAGHPVAGSERSGPSAGVAELFENRYVFLTPTEGFHIPALQALTRFWRKLGAMVEVMEPTHHDLVLAITSHLPHLIAYTIVGTAADLEDVTEGEVMKFSAGGFRDFTRIAASDPVMWRDVFLNNKEAVLEVLGRFSEDLSALQRAIRWGEADRLEDWFTRTRTIRQGIVELGQDTDEEDFGRRSKAPVPKPYGD